MNRLRVLTSSLLLLGVLAACAAPRQTAIPTAIAPASTAQPPNHPTTELFLARPDGARGPLVAYDVVNGQPRFDLPAGLMSADEKSYLAADAAGDKTMLRAFDVHTGQPVKAFPFDGRWELGAVSPNGRWAALARLWSEAEKQQPAGAKIVKAEVLVVDTQSGKAAHRVSLDGNFEVDGLSNRGDSLFLIEYLPALNPDHYQIRWFDLVTRKLQDSVLVDKRAPDEVMAGEAREAVGSRDGRWLLTLYLRTNGHSAFVHALNLNDKFTLCIDLPSGDGEMEKLKSYSLALAPDGYTLYAANPALGLAARVDLNDLNVTHAARFEAADPPSPGNPQTTGRSVISPDGKYLYFTNGERVWAHQTGSAAATAFDLSTPITSLGVSRDGHRLYATTTNRLLRVFDAASGAALSFPAMGQ